MGSHTQDQNIFLLTPLLASALNRKTSSKCPGSEEQKEMDRCGETIELQLKRYYCSGSKVPDVLIAEVVKKCVEQEGYAGIISENVFNNEVVVSHQIRVEFQINILKTLILKLEKLEIYVPDSIYDRLGELMGTKDGEFVERLYLDETGEKVLAKFSESVNQLSMGTTGLSVWQASCDLANLFRLIPQKGFSRIVELGAGCGVSGISIAKSHNCKVVLTDYDSNVLKLLEENAVANGLIDGDKPENQGKVRYLDWCNFEDSDWNEPADLVIAADVVYDTALLGSLCNVLRLLLRNARAAIVACTRRDPASISAFEQHLKAAELKVVEKIEYEDNLYSIDDGRFYPHPSIFPFHSSLKTPTIFYNIQSVQK